MALYTRTCASALRRRIFRPKNTVFSFSVDGVAFQVQRTLLSDAYKGNSSWRTRKILAVNMEELKIKLDADFFDLKKPVASVDLHKFIDNISDEHDLESAKRYLFCHRHSLVAHHLRASTVHCFLRACLDLGLANSALKVLQDKTNYGLFPDNFTFNLLLDDYLQRGDVKGAAAVAMEMMTLEVLTGEEPLSQLLALHACHEYLKTGQCGEEEMSNLGMTFADATKGHSSLLSSSYHILGLVMAGRWQEAVNVLQAALSSEGEGRPCVVQEVIGRIESLLDRHPDENQELRDELQDCMARLQADDRISNDSLDSLASSEPLLPQIEALQQSHPAAATYPDTLAAWHQEHVGAVRAHIRAGQEHERTLKRKKLDKLLEATGGLRYWLEKGEERRRGEVSGEGGTEEPDKDADIEQTA